ncbi:MAG TPA: dienelactone hydrolase family protein [Planctomycetota bacterium]|nr:dienelactone hydrolase family protein [Planctomycetota bacterium]
MGTLRRTRLSSSLLLLCAVLPLAACRSTTAEPAHDLRAREVVYSVGDLELRGYLAYDAALAGPRPGVLVVHEWWGHNDTTRRRARMLAEMGYVALALDMYGDGKRAEHPTDAQAFAGEVMSNKDVAVARFVAARELLTAQPQCDPERVAAIGYCFGGGVVLHMARIGLDLDAVASFHGSLKTDTPAEPGGVSARVLVLHGADDPFVAPEDVAALKAEMAAAGADWTFVAYPGVVHAFTNPDATALGERFDLPLVYDAEADRASWAELERFLAQTFAG